MDVRVQFLQDLEVLRNKPGLEKKILRRITRNGEFRRKDQFGAGGGEPLISGENFLKVAAEIADGGIDLSKTDLHAVLRRLCAPGRSAIAFEAGYGLAVRLIVGAVCL